MKPQRIVSKGIEQPVSIENVKTFQTHINS